MLSAAANNNKKEDVSAESSGSSKDDEFFGGVDNAIYSNTALGQNTIVLLQLALYAMVRGDLVGVGVLVKICIANCS